MFIKAVIIDFDGTLVKTDLLDIICDLNHQKVSSQRLNAAYQQGKISGIEALVRRINLLEGISLDQINQKLSERNYLRKGALELLQSLNKHQIISILTSGNILPVLQYYQYKLGISYIIGNNPPIINHKIAKIPPDALPSKDFKVKQVKKILQKLHIKQANVVAIGDSLADKTIFEFTAKSIAINPKGGIEKYSDFCIQDNLKEAIPIINTLSVRG